MKLIEMFHKYSLHFSSLDGNLVWTFYDHNNFPPSNIKKPYRWLHYFRTSCSLLGHLKLILICNGGPFTHSQRSRETFWNQSKGQAKRRGKRTRSRRTERKTVGIRGETGDETRDPKRERSREEGRGETEYSRRNILSCVHVEYAELLCSHFLK